MTPERWKQVTEVFHAAVARDTAARRALLDEACAGDGALRAEVEAMLAAHRDAGAFGQRPAFPAGEEAARLVAGAALGPYRIDILVESGGFGEVYRARDTRLDRDVAIKVLRLPVAGDPAWRQRLEREARALAALSHPHICPVFDVGRHDGIDYLVMEYLDGETLERRLTRGPLPLEQALSRAAEIADALDKAHRQGFVHRDLKPSNVMLTTRGAQLLDFGLAKLRPPSLLTPMAAGGAVPPRLTGQGAIIGTLQYMAPEQLNGEEADPRTDIFAFGAVTYEMVTGVKAFAGKTPASIIAAILEREPISISTLQPMSPPALDHLVRTCLAKDPERRWQSAGDVGRHLTWLLGEGAVAAGARESKPAPRRRAPWLVATALVALATFVGLTRLVDQQGSPRLLQSALSAPAGVHLQPDVGFALSRDGRRLAFVGRDAGGVQRVLVRTLAESQARPLAGTEGALAPFWSPDGKSIAFFADQKLKRIPVAGGPVQVLAGPTTEWARGGTWSADGRIVYAPNHRTGLSEVPANGGSARVLTVPDASHGETTHRWPQFLPDGRTLLFLVQTAEAGADDDDSRIEVLDPDGTRHEVLKVNSSALYDPAGRLLFHREGSLYAQGFDAKRLRLHGEAQRVADGVGLTLGEWATFTVSDEGTLVYAPSLPWRLEWRARSGKLLSVAAKGDYADAALSRDGRRIAYVANNITVWILDLVRGTHTRITFDDVDHWSPAWAPEGDWIAYAANKRSGGTGSEIIRRQPSGLGEREVLHSSEHQLRYVSWSPDGRGIVFEENGDLFLMDLVSRVRRTRASTPGFESYPRFSPDGRWLAYSSDESGRDEVYVVPALDGREKWQVSSGGGFEPRWSPDGRELFFLGIDNGLRVVAVAPGAAPEFGLPERLFVVEGARPRKSYDIGAAGILVRARLPEGETQSFTLVQNWPRLLDGPPP